MIRIKEAIFMKDEIKYMYEVPEGLKVVFKGNGGIKIVSNATINDVIDMDKETRNIKEEQETKTNKKGKNNNENKAMVG